MIIEPCYKKTAGYVYGQVRLLLRIRYTRQKIIFPKVMINC